MGEIRCSVKNDFSVGLITGFIMSLLMCSGILFVITDKYETKVIKQGCAEKGANGLEWIKRK